MDQKVVNPIDQELDRLEHDMRRLKVEYDIYFNGASAKPPYDTKARVDTTIQRLYDLRNMSFGQRFRYNGLVARYNVMRELWRKRTRDFEATGRPPTAEAAVASRAQTVVVRCHDPRDEPEKVCELYDHLVAAKRACGEKLGNLTLDLFNDFLRTRSDQIKQSLSSQAVDFVVGVTNGRVKFSARPVRQD